MQYNIPLIPYILYLLHLKVDADQTQSSFEATNISNLGSLTVIKINLNSITTKYMLKIQFLCDFDKLWNSNGR